MTEILEARVRAVEDELALTHLVNHYFTLADRSDWKRWSDLFADDGVFIVPISGEELTGRETIFSGVSKSLSGVFAATQHYITNLEVTVNGDSATASGELIFAALSENSRPNQYLMMGGHYRWSFGRGNGRWMITHAGNVLLWNNMPEDNAG